MNNKKQKVYILLLAVFNLLMLNAQESVNSSGGNADGSGGAISYSLGESVYTAHESSSGSINPGVQHAFTISEVQTSYESEKTISLTVFPNPTSDVLNLHVEDFTENKLQYKFFDLSGKILHAGTVTSNHTRIKTSGFVPSVYFLQVTRNNKLITHFKIIKK